MHHSELCLCRILGIPQQPWNNTSRRFLTLLAIDYGILSFPSIKSYVGTLDSS
jgi:hypothetical protein